MVRRPGQLVGGRPGQLVGGRPGQLVGGRPGQLVGGRPGQLVGGRPGLEEEDEDEDDSLVYNREDCTERTSVWVLESLILCLWEFGLL